MIHTKQEKNSFNAFILNTLAFFLAMGLFGWSVGNQYIIIGAMALGFVSLSFL